jgi:hypothetical protein
MDRDQYLVTTRTADFREGRTAFFEKRKRRSKATEKEWPGRRRLPGQQLPRGREDAARASYSPKW